MLIILLIGAISLFGIFFNVVLPLFATQVLNAGPAGFGFISSAFGIGSLFSALWIAWGNKQPSIRRMLISMISFCSLLLLFALSRNYPLSLVLIAAVGFSQIAFSALANTAIQSVTPDHLRGRVMSVYMAFFAGSTPIGNLLVGGLTLLMDPSLMLLVCAILALGSAVTGWVLRKPAEKDFAKSVLF
jgi:MFS family permease